MAQGMQETQVLSLGREDSLEEGLTTRFGILALRNVWTEEPWEATAHGFTKSQTRLSD